MRYGFTLLALLLSPMALEATVITSVRYDGSSCSANQTILGETTAGASFTCPGASASASANLFQLAVSGSKEADLPPVSSRASFDYDLLVTGTDQSGFLLIYPRFSHSMTVIAPSRIQFTNAQIGTLDLSSLIPGPEYLYIPYTAGVPVHLHAEVSGGAGLMDKTDTPGEYWASLDPVIRVTAQGTIDPSSGDPQYIDGASVVIVPEPSSGALVFTTLATIAFFFRRRSH
jgi:hypothetical protein